MDLPEKNWQISGKYVLVHNCKNIAKNTRRGLFDISVVICERNYYLNISLNFLSIMQIFHKVLSQICEARSHIKCGKVFLKSYIKYSMTKFFAIAA